SRSPLQKQIYEGFRAAILGRNLRPGQRVPSTRALALELQVSRIPVLNAYSQLLAEGYFQAHMGSGTFVSRSLPSHATFVENNDSDSRTFRSIPRLLSKRSALLPSYKVTPWADKWGAFIVGQPALEHFPFKVWSSLLNRHARNIRITSLH